MHVRCLANVCASRKPGTIWLTVLRISSLLGLLLRWARAVQRIARRHALCVSPMCLVYKIQTTCDINSLTHIH